MRSECDSDPVFLAQKVAQLSHPPTEADVSELVRRMGAGDREAVAIFLVRYGDLIRRRIRGKLHASVRRLFDSQDILSSFGRRLDSYVLGGNFSPRSEDEFWSLVFLVANCSVVDKVRAVEALQAKEGEDSDFAKLMLSRIRESEYQTGTSGGGNDSGLDLAEMLSILRSEQDRNIATLWTLGVPHAEIAVQMGLSHDVVRQRWHRIREFLRANLKGIAR